MEAAQFPQSLRSIACQARPSKTALRLWNTMKYVHPCWVSVLDQSTTAVGPLVFGLTPWCAAEVVVFVVPAGFHGWNVLKCSKLTPMEKNGVFAPTSSSIFGLKPHYLTIYRPTITASSPINDGKTLQVSQEKGVHEYSGKSWHMLCVCAHTLNCSDRCHGDCHVYYSLLRKHYDYDHDNIIEWIVMKVSLHDVLNDTMGKITMITIHDVLQSIIWILIFINVIHIITMIKVLYIDWVVFWKHLL
jgi:hypothetical protein